MSEKTKIPLTKKYTRFGFAAGAAATGLAAFTMDPDLSQEEELNLDQSDAPRETAAFDRPPEHQPNPKEVTAALSTTALLYLAYLSLSIHGHRRKVAYHEAGHALSLVHNKSEHYLNKVEIGGVLGGGHNEIFAAKNKVTPTAAKNYIKCMFSGRAAEHIGCKDDIFAGDLNDMQEARRIAKAIVASSSPSAEEDEELSTVTGIIDTTLRWLTTEKDIAKIMRECKDDAYDDLMQYEDELHTLAEALLEHKELSREQIFEVLGLEDNVENISPSPSEEQEPHNS